MIVLVRSFYEPGKFGPLKTYFKHLKAISFKDPAALRVQQGNQENAGIGPFLSTCQYGHNWGQPAQSTAAKWVSDIDKNCLIFSIP